MFSLSDFSSYKDGNGTKIWAVALSVVSGASFIAGTSYISYAYWYRYSPVPHRTIRSGPYAPVDLTFDFYRLSGLAFYALSIVTGIPAVILFHKANKSKPSEDIGCISSQVSSGEIECSLGFQPTGFGININF